MQRGPVARTRCALRPSNSCLTATCKQPGATNTPQYEHYVVADMVSVRVAPGVLVIQLSTPAWHH
jgi:hypothetical protein